LAGYFSGKAFTARLEGCAMFWSLSTFQRADDSSMQEFHLRDLFRQARHHFERWDSLDDIDRLLEENEELARVTKEKTGQVR